MARIKHITPQGSAIFPWLNIPDSRSFNGQPSRPAYKVSLRLEDSKDIKSLQKKIDGLVEEAYQKALEEAKPADRKKIIKAYPYSEETDEEGNETGAYLFKFKQNAEIKTRTGEIIKVSLALFDAKKNIMTDAIFSGSEIKVAFTSRPYYMGTTKTAGISCDLSAVQVLELAGSSAGAASFGFGEEDGYVAETTKKAEASADAAFEEIDDEDDF